MMRHSGGLASYQLQEHPEYRGASVLQELQPGAERRSPGGSASAAAYLTRSLDMMPSVERIGDRAPSRNGGKGKGGAVARKPPPVEPPELEASDEIAVEARMPPLFVENATVVT